ncbi:RNI-like protein [Laetiporus sulphureus 93-53]|uniref:RNI-like protein n=1 Tax=Laetiporus sulphureus 93-53 TaxID=1314785 RepID=A0A165IHK7_9APHY|nr:RNI-like protein [Laetiporus sulphureus 93-53]KZT13083.1 RNI-like protein [Laetiporus sulphureus 93-53]
MARGRSPAQSSTSGSDNEDDNYNKSAIFTPSDTSNIVPAKWPSRVQYLPLVSDSPPSSPALRLPPEILIHILKHLHSCKDLYHSLLVSRSWCECAVELLWCRPNVSKLSTLAKMMRVLSRDDQTFVYAYFIRRLNFLYLGSDLSDSLLSRLAHCVRLERLTLINCTSISDDGLTRVLPCCPNLVALDLTGLSDITDRSIVALASSAKRLQGINLGGCRMLTDVSILALAANTPLLRRIKLSNVDKITDAAMSAIAKSCPLLLEIDLNNCRLITDSAVRDIWLHCAQLRELRLSHCVELTDAAFPAPLKPEITFVPGFRPFPSSKPSASDELLPLRLSRIVELRMLDLTACSQITDDAIEGIVTAAPRLRNLVLAKCAQITDRAVESICKLERNLHYLHLGHASNITDLSVRGLARSCTRLRYIDLANCIQLTDMSVFELASLQRLKRVGLVRVNNLTDQAVYALADRYATLERIHLSYCDQITVLAVHFLLQKLPKLSHLSLTGIPAFRRPELQGFCRTPPQEFNSTQRAAFCVYSGKGVAELRNFLKDLFNHITQETSEADETEYEDHVYVNIPSYIDDVEAQEDNEETEDGEEGVLAEVYTHHPNTVVSRNDYRTNGANGADEHYAPYDGSVHTRQPIVAPRQLVAPRGRRDHPVASSSAAVEPNWTNGEPWSSIEITGTARRGRGFGQQPIIELSTSPTPSDAASNRSGGTNQSTGTGFFRSYTEASVAAAAAPRNGTMTPDLVFAEIGHGRGTGPGPSTILLQGQIVRGSDAAGVGVANGFHPGASVHSLPPPRTFSYSSASSVRLPVVDNDTSPDYPHDPRVLVDSSNSYQHSAVRTEDVASWSTAQHEAASRSLSDSSTTRELQESIHSALASQSGFFDNHEGDSTGRSVKRSLRNTINAAEQYASSFLFRGRSGSGAGQDGSAGASSNRDSHARGH